MPIEIRELVIKMTVDDAKQQKAGSGSGGDAEALAVIREEIIRECTDRIMQQLKNSKER
jgi:hypothetical protein